MVIAMSTAQQIIPFFSKTISLVIHELKIVLLSEFESFRTVI